MEEFSANLAVIVGIDDYRNGIPVLQTPGNDARALAELLAERYGYEVWLRTTPAETSRAALSHLLQEEIPARLKQEDTRLLFYYAGHGIAFDAGDRDGPEGFLIPGDARPDRDTYLAMDEVFRNLSTLPCRHVLTVLDCCFAGAFRWSATRDVVAPRLKLYVERYFHFIRNAAWQVITSSAHDERALDIPDGLPIGVRDTGARHSPFAAALLACLRGEAAEASRMEGGVLTASGLYSYLLTGIDAPQTPRSWPFPRHGRGEFVFRDPRQPLELASAEAEIVLDEESNPYRGLEPYRRTHSKLFFGREAETGRLEQEVAGRRLTVVVGPSGSGKSSLVRAGLAPRLEERAWKVLPTLQPGHDPWSGLAKVLAEIGGPGGESLRRNPAAWTRHARAWLQEDPRRHLVLLVDQLEELLVLAPKEAEPFLALLAHPLTGGDPILDRLHVVFTVRSDFEPAFDKSAFGDLWPAGRFLIRPMTQNELRDAIEKPAAERALFFESPELVERLVGEVLLMPGALPLLSFALSELYRLYLRSGRGDRTLTLADYRELGGVAGALRRRAEADYTAFGDPAYRKTMERVLLRMVGLQTGEVTRRRVFERELEYPAEGENRRVQEVLDLLVADRLLVRGAARDPRGGDDEPYVEPAHDTLITGWDRLNGWIREAGEELALQRRVTQASDDWLTGLRDRQLLWADDPRVPQLYGRRGIRRLVHRLRTVFPDRAAESPKPWLNQRELQFLAASHRAWRWLQVRIALSVLALLAAIALGWRVTRLAGENSELHQRTVARRLTQQVRVDLSGKNPDGNPQRALLLAVQAYNLAIRPETGGGLLASVDQALRQALAGTAPAAHRSPGRRVLPQPQADRVVFDPRDPNRLAIARLSGTIDLWDLTSGTTRSLGRRECGTAGDDWASGFLAARLGNDTVVSLAWDKARDQLTAFEIDGDIREYGPMSAANPACTLHFLGNRLCAGAASANGDWWAAVMATGRGTALYAVPREGARNLQELALGRGVEVCTGAAAFHPREARLAGGVDDALQLWTLGDGGTWKPRELARFAGPVRSVAFSQDGRWLAAAGGFSDVQGYVWLQAVGGGSEGSPVPLLTVDEASVEKVEFSASGRKLAASSTDHRIRVWDLDDLGEPPLVLAAEEWSLSELSFSPDETRLAALDVLQDRLEIWDLRTGELARAACKAVQSNLEWDDWARFVGEDEPYEKTCGDRPIPDSVLAHGDELVLSGKVSRGRAIFERLARIEPRLRVVPEERVEALLLQQRLAANLQPDRTHVAAALQAFRRGEALFDRQDLIPLSFKESLRLCRWGALLGEPAAALPVCDYAHRLLPGDEEVRDSRGIARALTGDWSGAAEDFQAAASLPRRDAWARELRQKRNPLTPPVLQSLLRETVAEHRALSPG